MVRSNASGERPGMTLRFVRLEAAGKALVERIVSGRRAGAPAGAPTRAPGRPRPVRAPWPARRRGRCWPVPRIARHGRRLRVRRASPTLTRSRRRHPCRRRCRRRRSPTPRPGRLGGAGPGSERHGRDPGGVGGAATPGRRSRSLRRAPSPRRRSSARRKRPHRRCLAPSSPAVERGTFEAPAAEVAAKVSTVEPGTSSPPHEVAAEVSDTSEAHASTVSPVESPAPEAAAKVSDTSEAHASTVSPVESPAPEVAAKVSDTSEAHASRVSTVEPPAPEVVSEVSDTLEPQASKVSDTVRTGARLRRPTVPAWRTPPARRHVPRGLGCRTARSRFAAAIPPERQPRRPGPSPRPGARLRRCRKARPRAPPAPSRSRPHRRPARPSNSPRRARPRPPRPPPLASPRRPRTGPDHRPASAARRLGAAGAGGHRIQGTGSAPAGRARAHARVGRRPRCDHASGGHPHRHPSRRAAAEPPSSSSSRRRSAATSRSMSPSRRSTTSRRRWGSRPRHTTGRPPRSPCSPRWRPPRRTRCRSRHHLRWTRPPSSRRARSGSSPGWTSEGGGAVESRAPAPLSLCRRPRGTRAGGPGPRRSDEARPPAATAARCRAQTAPVGSTELGIEINAESVRASWFHDGRAQPLVLDPVGVASRCRSGWSGSRGAPADAPAGCAGGGPLGRAPLPFLGTRPASDASRTVARRWPAGVVPDDRGEAAFALEGGAVGAGSSSPPCSAGSATAPRRSPPSGGAGGARVPGCLQHRPARAAARGRRARRLRGRAAGPGAHRGHDGLRPRARPGATAHPGLPDGREHLRHRRAGGLGHDLDMVACGGDASLGSANFDEQIALALDKGARADGAVLRRRIAEAAQLRASSRTRR